MTLSALQQHYFLKGKCPILTRKTLYNLGTIAKRTNGSIFTHIHPNILVIPAFLRSRNPHNLTKIPKFAMCIFGTQVAQQVDADLQPVNSPKHATGAGVQVMWERVLCNSSAINSLNILLCNRLRGMSLQISEEQFPNNLFARAIFLV